MRAGGIYLAHHRNISAAGKLNRSPEARKPCSNNNNIVVKLHARSPDKFTCMDNASQSIILHLTAVKYYILHIFIDTKQPLLYI
jgi:hypothetical protein